jgi:acetyl esterase/lipase
MVSAATVSPRASPVLLGHPPQAFVQAYTNTLLTMMMPFMFALTAPIRFMQTIGAHITSHTIGYLSAVVATVTVRMVRWNMDTFWSWYQEKKWLPNAANYAQDGAPVMEGVRSIHTELYGTVKREMCHVLTPTKSTGGVVVYIHGGGFVVANSTVLLHSITLFCRQGFTVYSLDYPHAPENRFPAPLISVLKAISWLKTTHNVESISLFGDSAGV